MNELVLSNTILLIIIMTIERKQTQKNQVELVKKLTDYQSPVHLAYPRIVLHLRP